MTTLTIKINEKTKKGKAFLEMARAFSEDSKEIEIVKIPNATTLKAFSDTDNGIGLTRVKDIDDLFKQLNS